VDKNAKVALRLFRRNKYVWLMTAMAVLAGYSLDSAASFLLRVDQQAREKVELENHQKQALAQANEQLFELTQARLHSASLLDSALRGTNGDVRTPEIKLLIWERKRKYDDAYMDWNVRLNVLAARIEANLDAGAKWGKVSKIVTEVFSQSYFREVDKCLTNRVQDYVNGRIYEEVKTVEAQPAAPLTTYNVGNPNAHGCVHASEKITYKAFSNCSFALYRSLATQSSDQAISDFRRTLEELTNPVGNSSSVSRSVFTGRRCPSA